MSDDVYYEGTGIVSALHEGRVKVPREIRAGAHRVQVIVPYVFRERFDVSGQMDLGGMELRLALQDAGGGLYAETRIGQAFFHEVLHLADRTSGRRVFDGKEGEDACDGIAEVLLQVLSPLLDSRKIRFHSRLVEKGE